MNLIRLILYLISSHSILIFLAGTNNNSIFSKFVWFDVISGLIYLVTNKVSFVYVWSPLPGKISHQQQIAYFDLSLIYSVQLSQGKMF